MSNRYVRLDCKLQVTSLITYYRSLVRNFCNSLLPRLMSFSARCNATLSVFSTYSILLAMVTLLPTLCTVTYFQACQTLQRNGCINCPAGAIQMHTVLYAYACITQNPATESPCQPTTYFLRQFPLSSVHNPSTLLRIIPAVFYIDVCCKPTVPNYDIPYCHTCGRSNVSCPLTTPASP